MIKEIINPEKQFYDFLKEKGLYVDIKTLDGKKFFKRKVLDYSLKTRRIIFDGGLSFHFKDLYRLRLVLKNPTKFLKAFKKFPPSESFKKFETKRIYIYPYDKKPKDYMLIRFYKYTLLLYRRKQRKKGYIHFIDFIYKLGISAFSLFTLYPENLIKKDEAISPHEANTWRSEIKEIFKCLKNEFKTRDSKELLVTLALKDGREITGLLNKDSLNYFSAKLKAPKLKRYIFIFSHAIDDFWINE